MGNYKLIFKKMAANLERIRAHLSKLIKAPQSYLYHHSSYLYHYKNDLRQYVGSMGSRSVLKKIRKASIIWHVSTSKTASKFLMNYLSAILHKQKANINFFTGVPFHENRPQVFCQYHIIQRIKSQRVNISVQQHALATNDLHQMISDNHVVMCQTRGILDSIVSLINHCNTRRPLIPYSPMAELYWSRLSDEQKIDDMIEYYLPWHIAFLQGWLVASEIYDVFWIDYSEVVKDPRNYIKQVFLKFNIPLNNIASPDKMNLSSAEKNLNTLIKGFAGQGREIIPVSQQDRIAEKIEKADHLGQNLVRFL